MHDQQQNYQMPAKDRRDVQMGKAGAQPLLQLDALEELLNSDFRAALSVTKI